MASTPGRAAALVLASLAALLFRAAPALACAVCYGDPDSAMVKGANAGVAVLLVIIVSVLAWFGGMMIYFVRRARRLAGQNEGPGA